MIAPRRTRLVRVRNLPRFRRAVRALASDGSDPANTAVIVPNDGAARQLRASAHGALLVTRDGWLDLLRDRLPGAPRWLAPCERDTVAQAAAAEAVETEPGLSFRLRPGLVSEMLGFYDALKRQLQTVGRFVQLIDQAVATGTGDIDRSARKMLEQTRFLAAMFLAYERRVADSGACDEHVLRARLVEGPISPPLRHVVVAVADWIADPAGLHLSDFDLLARMPGLETLDIVSTESVLGSGYHERLHNWLPGLEESPDPEPADRAAPDGPVLLCPAGTPEQTWFTCRDREEELVAIARRLKRAARHQRTERPDRQGARAGSPGAPIRLNRSAVVYKRPLPYLYLAPATFGAAGIPYQVSDALPLAGEPTAAALDLVLEFVETSFGRDAIVSFLRSPHFGPWLVGGELGCESVTALDRVLRQTRYLGGLPQLEQIAYDDVREPSAGPALRAVLRVARELAPLADPAPASVQLRRVVAFFTTHARPLDDTDRFAGRERSARGAIHAVLARMADAHAAHHDPTWTIEHAAPEIRRWLERETFPQEGAGRGVHLLDDQAARFGEFDHLALVGLVEHEWPEPRRRNIFYPPALLKALGWPPETERRAAEDARFLDLLESASGSVSVSTCSLDDDRLVMRSVQLDEIARARLPSTAEAGTDRVRIFADEALAIAPPALTGLPDGPRGWAGMRIERPPADAPRFHGFVGPPEARSWSISALETYLQCPFKFFARHLLRLEEEPDDGDVMDPREQGLFVHAVFEAFYKAWRQSGRLAITPQHLDDARRLFAVVAERELQRLPESEAALERTRLLGSAAAVGLGETVLRLEADRPAPVVERLIEHRLQGTFTIDTSTGPREVALAGKADRLDLLEDGTFRLLDYKLGWPPNRARALQLPIYALCAEQRLADRRGRPWKLGEAAYVAFKGPRRVVPLFASAAERERVLAAAQQRLSDTLDSIARGEFPPRPDDVFRCETCSAAAVCRRDYA